MRSKSYFDRTTCATSLSVKGAKCKSLGHRPRKKSGQTESAEGARYKVPIANCQWFFAERTYSAPSALRRIASRFPWGDAPGYCISRPWRLVEPYISGQQGSSTTLLTFSRGLR